MLMHWETRRISSAGWKQYAGVEAVERKGRDEECDARKYLEIEMYVAGGDGTTHDYRAPVNNRECQYVPPAGWMLMSTMPALYRSDYK